MTTTKAVESSLTPLQTELLNKADVILGYVGNTVNAAVEFTKEQVPDIAYQFITFNRAYLSFIELASAVVLGIGLWLVINVATRNTYGFAVEKYRGWHDARTCALLFGGLLVFCSFLVFAINLKSFLLVWFAPKLFLIVSLSQLLKG